MTEPATIRESLTDLAKAFGVPLDGLTDDELATIADRLMREKQLAPTPVWMGRIVDQVRHERAEEAEYQVRAGTIGHSPTPAASSAPRRPRFLATERTTRLRLAAKHDAENKRTGLYIVPRKPEVLSPFEAHAGCKVAYSDGGTPCYRCLPLLHPIDCDCDPCIAWCERTDEA